MAKKPNALDPDAPLEFYGLPQLGYADNLPLTGAKVTDQLMIESICHRIALKREEGGLGAFGHFKNYVDLIWNNEAVGSPKKFVWNSWSDRMLRAACEYQQLGVAGATSAGKCLSIVTEVLMHDLSVKKAGHLIIGDQLRGDDHHPRTVQEIHRGYGPMFRVVPQDGIPWECNEYHIHVVAVHDPEGKWHHINATTKQLLRFREDKKFVGHDAYLIRKHPDTPGELVPFTIEPIEDGHWIGFTVDHNHRHLLADGTVTHNSGPFALWGVAKYLMDPTHTKVIVMSETLQGAKDRVWKDVMTYWNGVPGAPGRYQKSENQILGLNYDLQSFHNDSGLQLVATQKSNEASAMDKLIGRKAPKTGFPGGTLDDLLEKPQFRDLAKKFDRYYLEDLIPRLLNLEEDRIGNIIVIADEATGMAPGVLNAMLTNLLPGNVGHCQIIMLGNPASHFDPFGLFCEPAAGWESVTLRDEEWETVSGGHCIRFNAENNPRIVEKNEKCFWMLRKEEIEGFLKKYGRDSLYFYRMILGFWAPKGMESSVYSEADFLSTGSMKTADTVKWGFQPPTMISSFDPSFVAGGDLASCTFFKLGHDISGNHVLVRTENIGLKVDINSKTPVPIQLVRLWRMECERRGVLPKNACFDSTGGGISFAALVHTHWSPEVQAISSGGKASTNLMPDEKDADGKRLRYCDRYANKATEIFYGAHPFLRSGQIRGITAELAKEICSRQHDKGSGDTRMLKIESKRVFKSREKHSPDDSDSFMLGIEHAKSRHGFKPSGNDVDILEDLPVRKDSTWKEFVKKARRITIHKALLKR